MVPKSPHSTEAVPQGITQALQLARDALDAKATVLKALSSRTRNEAIGTRAIIRRLDEACEAAGIKLIIRPKAEPRKGQSHND